MSEKQCPRYPNPKRRMPLVEAAHAEAAQEIAAAINDKTLWPLIHKFFDAFDAWDKVRQSAFSEMETDMMGFRFRRLSAAVREKCPKAARLFGGNWDDNFGLAAYAMAMRAQGMPPEKFKRALAAVCPPWLKTERLVIGGALGLTGRGS